MATTTLVESPPNNSSGKKWKNPFRKKATTTPTNRGGMVRKLQGSFRRSKSDPKIISETMPKKNLIPRFATGGGSPYVRHTIILP